VAPFYDSTGSKQQIASIQRWTDRSLLCVQGAESRPPGRCGHPRRAREPTSTGWQGPVKVAVAGAERSGAEGAAPRRGPTLTGRRLVLGSWDARRGRQRAAEDVTACDDARGGAEGGSNAAIPLGRDTLGDHRDATTALEAQGREERDVTSERYTSRR
jgi:hypothetical protein